MVHVHMCTNLDIPIAKISLQELSSTLLLDKIEYPYWREQFACNFHSDYSNIISQALIFPMVLTTIH